MERHDREALDRHITGNYGEDRFQPEPLFVVTCEIGAVWEDDSGEGRSAVEAAYSLIAKHDTQGTFRFRLNDCEYVIDVRL